MIKSSSTCHSLGTKAKKYWTYDEYYTGLRDHERRKNGQGENHWSGPESLEWYTGHFIRDTMHGLGDYRWRHRGPEGIFVTYEGHFYSNCMHGYGTMSYPDGRVFTGLYHSNVRWGPGIEYSACMRDNVGLWRGTQLIRLAWRPQTPNIIPDLAAGSIGRACVEPHRIAFVATTKTIGEINSALDLLKQFGSNPRWAADQWIKLYPKHCTDQASQLCQTDIFEHTYYNEPLHILKEIKSMLTVSESPDNMGNLEGTELYFAWNNSDTIVHMIKHCYQHEMQRSSEIDLASIISGPRKKYKPAAKHEIDCRTLLMASYLGDLTNVVQMVNDLNVHPDVADNQGNTALMYATCGDQCDVIHFIVEAGANVNNYNDSCYTALGIALMRFACLQKDITTNGMLQALLPPPVVPTPPLPEHTILEWNMTRDQENVIGASLIRTTSKSSKNVTAKAIVNKSSQSLKEVLSAKKKTEVPLAKPTELYELDSDETFSVNRSVYQNISNEYSIKVKDLFSVTSGTIPIPYIFKINDLVKEVDLNEDEPKKLNDNVSKKVASKIYKDTIKLSKEIMWQSSDCDENSATIDSVQKQKTDMLTRVMSTILQLLSDGANPKLIKCPQSALFIAAVADSSDLVRHLVNYGADINEICCQTLGYTPLDVAVSRPFTYKNLEVIRAILECGGNTNYRLQYGDLGSNPLIPGPTLLHAVLAKRTENEIEEQIRQQTIELLLEYNCNPMIQFKGRSAVDVAMTKNFNLLNIFLKSPGCNLNAIINDQNQTVLVKMFYLPFFKTPGVTDRLQILTNLLLFGADPFIECQHGGVKYQNIFVFAKKSLMELESSLGKTNPVTTQNKSDVKNKMKDKPKKGEELSTKSIGKMTVDVVGDYKQAIELVTECARLLYIRWLQAKLMIELVELINKFKHRHWNIILKEHKHKKSTGLWLTPQRCLEIWDIFKTKQKKMYSDKRILKHLLCIVQYYQIKFKFGYVSKSVPTAQEKNIIDSSVLSILQENKSAEILTPKIIFWKKPYVMPELVKNDEKFKVCFECILPLAEEKIQCKCCKLVAFCSFDCMKINIDRINCHPCSEYLKNNFFSSDNPKNNEEIEPFNLLK
ncbi:ankyrin repeat and MYND domain-containing protein 1-like [Galleria mellonella]|uniref:Ankyrin repeat and MYND domain-containing protein 1-like n=1 Tax=Galleria mellonella TaxID=7137 RepID=A0A6J3CCR0_GALME|nr:ankyrin repeat and MYND domain-containing protein 1-like [Galleria mellonella]